MAAPGRFVRVRTDAGWHLRLVGGNGETVLTSEVYDDKRQVDNAVDVVMATVTKHPVDGYTSVMFGTLTDLDERETDPPGSHV